MKTPYQMCSAVLQHCYRVIQDVLELQYSFQVLIESMAVILKEAGEEGSFLAAVVYIVLHSPFAPLVTAEIAVVGSQSQVYNAFFFFFFLT